MNRPAGIEGRAFNTAYGRRVRELVTEVRIFSAFNPSHPPDESQTKKYLAVWDTGATKSVITEKVVQECDLKPIGVTTVHHVEGESRSDVYLASIWLPDKVCFPQLRVTKGMSGGGADVLLGMDVICMGDFAVTNVDGKTNLSFRMPSLECLDFVKQQPPVIQSGTKTLYKVGRNDKCPCGSGKKYKKCHGMNK